MTPINELLSQKEIINQERIKEIREWINIRYQTSTPKQKARILAKTIHNLIDSSLPNFSKESKKSVREALVNQKLLKNSLTITANDIIESSMEFVAVEEIEEKMTVWVKNKVKVDMDRAEKHIVNLLNNNQKIEGEVAISNRFSLTDISMIPIEKEITLTNQPISKSKQLFNKKYMIGSIAILLISISAIVGFDQYFERANAVSKGEKVESTAAETKTRMHNELPARLQYESINDAKLRAWLKKRNSLLADEPYFSSILEAAKEFNINPLLLFAITGQEQGFVSRDHKNAKKIANNPFNVFHSWEDFNTNISESSQIAARTIVNLSKGRPKNTDPIKWINRKYAEDKKWWLGVSSIYKQLEGVVK